MCFVIVCSKFRGKCISPDFRLYRKLNHRKKKQKEEKLLLIFLVSEWVKKMNFKFYWIFFGEEFLMRSKHSNDHSLNVVTITSEIKKVRSQGNQFKVYQNLNCSKQGRSSGRNEKVKLFTYIRRLSEKPRGKKKVTLQGEWLKAMKLICKLH